MRTSTLYLRAPRFPGPGRRPRSDPSHHGPVPAGQVASDVDVDEPGPPGDVDRRRGLMGSQLDDDRAGPGQPRRRPDEHGLDRGEPRTLEEVGEHFNLTRERIRQIEARAMSKLRHPSSDTGARDLLTL